MFFKTKRREKMRDLLMQELDEDNFLKTDVDCDSNEQTPVKDADGDEESVDPVMMHVAKDVSQQTYEIEKKKRADKERLMEEEAIRRSLIDHQRQQQAEEERARYEQEQARQALLMSMQQQQPQYTPKPPVGRPESVAYNRDMEEAIQLSLMESNKPDFYSIYQGSQRPRNIPPPIPIAQRDSPNLMSVGQPRSANGTPKGVDSQNSTPKNYGSSSKDNYLDRKTSTDEITDPAILAFMEKRKMRVQQQKDEALAKQLLAEASRLNVNPQHIVSDLRPTTESSQKLSKTSLKSFSCDAYGGYNNREPALLTREVAPKLTRGSSQDPWIENVRNDRSYSFDTPEQSESPGISPAFNASLSRSNDGGGVFVPSTRPDAVASGVTLPSPIHDPSHILHPDNTIALKTIDALIHTARVRIRQLPQYDAVGGDAAAIQLASLWMSQVSLLTLSGQPLQSATNESKPVIVSPSGIERPIQQSSANEISKVRSNSFIKSSPTPTIQRTFSADNNNRPLPTPVRMKKEEQWSCSVCTLLNSLSNQVCDACGSPRG